MKIICDYSVHISVYDAKVEDFLGIIDLQSNNKRAHITPKQYQRFDSAFSINFLDISYSHEFVRQQLHL